MKGRESGMPEEGDWDSYFTPGAALARIVPGGLIEGDLAEFGCGYGTFTIPAALRTGGIVTALDIEPAMVRLTSDKAARLGLANVRAELRDFLSDGTGLPEASQAHAMIYNLLHIEQPLALLQEARRVLRPRGVLSVMHWRSDIDTPRGPPLEIRPTPEQCRGWLLDAGFATIDEVDLGETCPYHFALVAI